MKLKITIKMDSTAFKPQNGTEAARILRYIANKIDGTDWGTYSRELHDQDGGLIGNVRVTK